MPDITALKGEPKPTKAVYNGTEIQITFDPDFYTPEVEEVLAAADRPVGALASALAGCLASWDITRDKAPIPITEENLRGFGAGLLGALANAVFEASSPNAASSQG